MRHEIQAESVTIDASGALLVRISYPSVLSYMHCLEKVKSGVPPVIRLPSHSLSQMQWSSLHKTACTFFPALKEQLHKTVWTGVLAGHAGALPGFPVVAACHSQTQLVT